MLYKFPFNFFFFFLKTAVDHRTPGRVRVMLEACGQKQCSKLCCKAHLGRLPSRHRKCRAYPTAAIWEPPLWWLRLAIQCPGEPLTPQMPCFHSAAASPTSRPGATALPHQRGDVLNMSHSQSCRILNNATEDMLEARQLTMAGLHVGSRTSSISII